MNHASFAEATVPDPRLSRLDGLAAEMTERRAAAPRISGRRRRGVARGLAALSLVFAAQGLTSVVNAATCAGRAPEVGHEAPVLVDAATQSVIDVAAQVAAPARLVVDASEGRAPWMRCALTPAAGFVGSTCAVDGMQPAVDFSRPAVFQALAAVREPRAGGIEFSVAARPAYAEGTLAEWLDRLCYSERLDRGTITTTVVGGRPAVMCDAIELGANGASSMRRRIVLLEDGGRVFRLTLRAPQMFWAAGLARLDPMLRSFELTEVHGARMALLPGEGVPEVVPAIAGERRSAGTPASS